MQRLITERYVFIKAKQNPGGLICSCFCSYNSRHEFAAMPQLRETPELIEKYCGDEYERTGCPNIENANCMQDVE